MTSRTRTTVAALLLAVFLAGCSGDSEEKLLESARGYLDKKDPTSALIQLRTALQKNPKSGQARLLLGRALLETGDAKGAVIELGKALDAGIPAEQIVPDLARGTLQSGDPAKTIAQYGATELKEASAAADLAATLAAAYAATGDRTKAAEQAGKSLRAVPDFIPALLVQAQLKVADGDSDGAIAQLDAILAKDATQQRAGLMKGELLWVVRQDREGALAAYRQVVTAHPKSVIARSAVVRLLSEKGDSEQAAAEVAALAKVAPDHPETLVLKALAAYARQDDADVQAQTGRVLKILPDHVLALELAGASALRQRNYGLAENHLSRAVKSAPNRPLARKLLAQTLLRVNQPTRAVETLLPLLQAENVDGALLALAGEAMMQMGDVKRADELLKRALETAPKDARVRMSAALARLARGEPAAVRELEALAADDKGPRADLAVVSARLSSNDFAGALQAVDALAKKMPEQPLPPFLRGRVLLARGDAAGATREFEASLAKDANYFPAAATLASLEMQAGKNDAAKKRFDALAKADPANFRAHLGLARIASQTGAGTDVVLRHLDDAAKAAPMEPEPRLLIVTEQLRAGDTKAALASAQSAAKAMPERPEVVEALGRAQLLSNDAAQAVETLRGVIDMQPRNTRAMILLADAQMATKDAPGARATLRRAVDVDPHALPPRRALIALSLQRKKFDEALTVARELQTLTPKDGAGFALEGDIEAARGNSAAAAAAMRAALLRSRTTPYAIGLHKALLAAGQRADADRLAADWRKEQPKDALFLLYVGDEVLKRKDWPAAEAAYREVLAVQPNNPMALNNVAWLMVQQSKPGALALAEQANQALPGRAPLLDTLASALAAENQVPRAIETQKKAIAASPRDDGLRLNLARLYLKAGDKAAARTELLALAKLGSAFGGQSEVEQLLKSAQ